jgi:hypothetical protein
MSEEMRQALDERHHLIEQRADAVLRGALTDNEAWAVALGPTPKDRKQHDAWWRAARAVAAYRDRYQITDDHAPLGIAPITTRQKIDAARAGAALRAARDVATDPRPGSSERPTVLEERGLAL